ncbi:hypothetical protein [Gluconobacter cerinus]|uniref:hypothetical protein n=1 Tax=Gluconobacter cerinus TaxID=38307 RepID=UPI001B8BE2B1|nr:hypothetical protein [Gluconobacter cerinus]MBS0982143.1 hypothetical protein [Gluconobacter cerinus]
MRRRSSAVKWSDVLAGQIAVNTASTLSSPALHALVAQECRDLRDQAIQQGAAPETYVTRVDGFLNRPEEEVRLDQGLVTYIFSDLAQAANWAMAECQKRSPVKSGDFRKSWRILVDNKEWTNPAATIPMGSEVWIVNTMPYARKIEVGGMQIRTDPKIVEAVRQTVGRRFPRVLAARTFKTLSGGRDARGGPVPYVLKQSGVASGLSWTKKSGWSRKHKSYTSRRKDRQAGQQVLYPTLILTERIS